MPPPWDHLKAFMNAFKCFLMFSFIRIVAQGMFVKTRVMSRGQGGIERALLPISARMLLNAFNCF